MVRRRPQFPATAQPGVSLTPGPRLPQGFTESSGVGNGNGQVRPLRALARPGRYLRPCRAVSLEADFNATDLETMLDGQHSNPIRVIAFNVGEG